MRLTCQGFLTGLLQWGSMRMFLCFWTGGADKVGEPEITLNK